MSVACDVFFIDLSTSLLPVMSFHRSEHISFACDEFFIDLSTSLACHVFFIDLSTCPLPVLCFSYIWAHLYCLWCVFHTTEHMPLCQWWLHMPPCSFFVTTVATLYLFCSYGMVCCSSWEGTWCVLQLGQSTCSSGWIQGKLLQKIQLKRGSFWSILCSWTAFESTSVGTCESTSARASSSTSARTCWTWPVSYMAQFICS